VDASPRLDKKIAPREEEKINIKKKTPRGSNSRAQTPRDEKDYTNGKDKKESEEKPEITEGNSKNRKGVPPLSNIGKDGNNGTSGSDGKKRRN